MYMESFCRFEVRAHVENGLLLKSFALIYACIQENYFFVCDFSREFYGRMIAIC